MSTNPAGGAGGPTGTGGQTPGDLAFSRVHGTALDANVVLRRRTFVLSAAITAAPGEVVALMGPNGCGKSTMLSVLAGLAVPDSGTVRLGDRTLTGPGVLVAAEHRRVGLMGQDPLLFPHLTALENIAFGPRSQGVPKAAARVRAAEWLDTVGLDGFATRRPDQLSGGQRQRVALARALAAEPELLLLDEPLGALDVSTAPEIRQVLRTHLRATGTTTVLVTHDVLDTAVLADRAVVLAAGSVVDEGPALELFASPRSEFSAALAGLNLVPGTVDAAAGPGELTTIAVAGTAPAGATGMTLTGVADGRLAAGDAVAAVFAPSAVSVFLTRPEQGSPRNTWPAFLQAMEPSPATIRLRTVSHAADGPPAGGSLVAADVTPAAVAELGLAGGERVWLAVKASEVRIYHR